MLAHYAPSRIALHLGVLLLIGVCCLRSFAAYDMGEPVKGDAGGYIATAFNLYSEGIFSHQCQDFSVPCPTEKLAPSNNREALYPLYLALAFNLYPAEIRRQDLFTQPFQMHPDVHQFLRKFTMVTIIVAAVFAAGCAYLITGSVVVGYVSTLLVATSPTLTENIKYFLTENLACMLLTATIFFILLALKKKSFPCVAIAGGVFGLLALTKSIYCYGFYLLLVAVVLYLLWRRSVIKELGKSALLFSLCYISVVGAWSVRNYIAVGSSSISNRGGMMLMIRAYYGRADFEEFKSLFWYQTPFRKLVEPSEETLVRVARVDRSNPEGFYLGSKAYARELSKKLGATQAEKVLKSEALREILQRPFKHIAVSIPLAVNGLFVEGNRRVNDWMLADRLLMGFIFFGTVVGAVITAVLRRDGNLFILIAPVLFSITIHSLVSNSLPRYNEPVLGVFWAAFAVLGYWVFLRAKQLLVSRKPVSALG